MNQEIFIHKVFKMNDLKSQPGNPAGFFIGKEKKLSKTKTIQMILFKTLQDVEMEREREKDLPDISRRWVNEIIQKILDHEEMIDIDPNYFGLNDGNILFNQRALDIEEAVLSFLYPAASIYKREYAGDFGIPDCLMEKDLLMSGQGNLDPQKFEEGQTFYTDWKIFPFDYCFKRDQVYEFQTIEMIAQIRTLLKVTDEIKETVPKESWIDELKNLVLSTIRPDLYSCNICLAEAIYYHQGSPAHAARLFSLLAQRLGYEICEAEVSLKLDGISIDLPLHILIDQEGPILCDLFSGPELIDFFIQEITGRDSEFLGNEGR